MRSNANTVFLQGLSAEVEAVDRFVTLLKTEQIALSKGDTETLPVLAENKDKVAAQLASLAVQRNTFLTSQGFSSDRPGIDSWCSSNPNETEALGAWTKIIELASEARELNRLNGELIRMRMQYNASALEALRRSGNSLDLYGPDGQAKTIEQRRINDAV